MIDPINFKLKRIHRIGIMASLIVLFFVISPLVLFYTAGYRYSLRDRLVSQTGVISITIEPRDARVFINDILIGRSLPIRLTNRAPGVYRVRAERAGYKTWEHNLVVESNQTTYIRDITLLKDQLPELIHEAPADGFSLFVFPKNKEYMTLNASEGGYTLERRDSTFASETVTLASFETSPEVSVSPFHPLALTLDTAKYLHRLMFFDMARANRSVASSTIPIEVPVEFQWSKRNNEVYLRVGTSIKIYELSGRETVLGHSGAPLWYVEFPGTVWLAEGTTLALAEFPDISYHIPSHTVNIIDINKDRIILQTDSGITVIDRNADAANQEHTLAAHSIQYNIFTDEWWAWSDFEFWKIRTQGTPELASRHSGGMKVIRPLDKFGLLVFSDHDDMTAQNPGLFPQQSLMRAPYISHMETIPGERLILFTGTVGQKNGLFRLGY